MGKSKASKAGKKCRGCGLDCSILRAIALDKISDSERKERAIAMFGSEKPKYTQENCPKR